MSFILIKGTYHINGYSPDGDSIRFEADDPATWDLLDVPPVAKNGRNHAQLRLEGIDTLETHYHQFHQPLGLAQEGTTFLLSQLGFVLPGLDVRVETVNTAMNGSRGYILSRKTEKFGRPVAFVYSGDTVEDNGSEIFLTPEKVEESVNFKSLQTGNAYPTYYTGLFFDLRNRLTDAVIEARGAGAGVWRLDSTNAGFDVPNFQSVSDIHVIMPKLFRRIADYIGNGGSIAGFKQFLESRPDPVLLLGSCHFTNLDTFIEVLNDCVTLKIEPENLVFVE